MFGKASIFKSVLEHRCPRCHEGHLFSEHNPYNLKTPFEMPDTCPVCGQKYNLEPGFYYGAMYVNYGLTIAISVATFVAMYTLGAPWEIHEYLIGIFLVLLLLMPYSFRTARAIWINFFVSYSPKET